MYALNLSDDVKHFSDMKTNIIPKAINDTTILTNKPNLLNEAKKLAIMRVALVIVNIQRYLWSVLLISVNAGLI